MPDDHCRSCSGSELVIDFPLELVVVILDLAVVTKLLGFVCSFNLLFLLCFALFACASSLSVLLFKFLFIANFWLTFFPLLR